MGIFSSLLGGISDLQTVAGNFGNLKQQQELYQRQDTAIQRGAADMKAAGINPILAAGNPASSQPLNAGIKSSGAAADALAKAATIDLQSEQTKVARENVKHVQAQNTILEPEVRVARNKSANLSNLFNSGKDQSGNTLQEFQNLQMQNMFGAMRTEKDRYDIAASHGIPVEALSGPLGQAILAEKALSTGSVKDKALLIALTAANAGIRR